MRFQKGRVPSPESIARWRETRKKNDIKRSPEAREKSRQALKGRQPSALCMENSRLSHLGKKQSPEHVEKGRLSRIGKKKSLECRMKQKEKALQRWAKPGAKEEQARIVRESWDNPTVRLNHAETVRTVSKGRRRVEYLSASGKIYYLRSSWEVEVAKVFDEIGLTWFYEPTKILLSDGRVYIPDFFVVEWNQYIEIKGWERWNEDKVEIAIQDGHDIRMVLGQNEYESFLHEVRKTCHAV